MCKIYDVNSKLQAAEPDNFYVIDMGFIAYDKMDGAAERRTTLRRKTECRRLNVERLNVED